MKNYLIDWEKLTKIEAEEILKRLVAECDVYASCYHFQGLKEDLNPVVFIQIGPEGAV